MHETNNLEEARARLQWCYKMVSQVAATVDDDLTDLVWKTKQACDACSSAINAVQASAEEAHRAASATRRR